MSRTLIVGSRSSDATSYRSRMCHDELRAVVALSTRLINAFGLHHAAPARASLRARQTLRADAGISKCVTPAGRSASSTAFIAAGNAPVVPASPAPLTPNGLFGDGTQESPILNRVSMSARGIA